MSAKPGSIQKCKNCPYRGTVCPDSCGIYQDLKAEYNNDMKMEMDGYGKDPIEDYDYNDSIGPK